MTQMTPGSMAVVPQNSYERSWNVVCLVIGLFVSALLISQLSARMVSVSMMNQDLAPIAIYPWPQSGTMRGGVFPLG